MDFQKKIIIPENLKNSGLFVGGFSTPLLGNQSFFRPLVSLEVTRQNRKDLAETLGISIDHIVSPHLIHSNRVLSVGLEERGRGALDGDSTIGEADGLITSVQEVFLLTTAADCIPLLLWDQKKRVCASIHAGRRGLMKGIILQGVQRMKELCRCDPRDIFGAIGPCIHGCCYSVDQKTAQEYALSLGEKFISTREGTCYLDLLEGALFHLESQGIPRENMEWVDHCTSCHPKVYYSARREGQKYFQTLAAVIGAKEHV